MKTLLHGGDLCRCSGVQFMPYNYKENNTGKAKGARGINGTMSFQVPYLMFKNKEIISSLGTLIFNCTSKVL